jgi:hypothetical protein
MEHIKLHRNANSEHCHLQALKGYGLYHAHTTRVCATRSHGLVILVHLVVCLTTAPKPLLKSSPHSAI